jgi:hypothetical protein
VNIKGTVKYSNVQALQNIMNELDKERRNVDRTVLRGGKLTRYHNYTLQ